MRHLRLIALGAVLATVLSIAIPQYVEMHAVERRKEFQKAQLKGMLAAVSPRFRHVRVTYGTQPYVALDGYVKTREEAAELRQEMLRRVGADEVGKTAIFNVQVVPPGARSLSTGEDFWASLEKQ
jgi:hypothetical protein